MPPILSTTFLSSLSSTSSTASTASSASTASKPFIDTFDNKTNGDCTTDCTNLCSSFIDNDSEESNQYNQCLNSCSKVLVSCQNYCNDNNNSNSIYCNGTNSINASCPIFYKKNGQYMVYTQFNGKEESYGTDMNTAKNTYMTNYPNCPLNTQNNSTCPFIINELNPCYTSVCDGVNWDTNDYNKLNLNKNCKTVVSNYCSINYNTDKKCMCWDPKYTNDPKCIAYKNYFENNQQCAQNNYKIEDHPDFNKYVKKDNIPCWGCSL